MYVPWKRFRTWVAVFPWILLTAQVAPAADKTVAEKLLDIMRDHGMIDDEQYDDLQAEARHEAAVLAGKTPPVGGEDPTDWKVRWKNGTRIERNDGAFKIKLGGRIQNDSAALHESNGLKSYLRANGVTNPGGGTGVEFRRARLFVEGLLYEQFFFKAQYDFADGTSDFKDMFMGMKDIPWIGQVTVGHFKQPFSLGELTSSKYITLMEQSPVNVFSPSRDTGIGIQNTAHEKRMTWALGLFRGDTDKFGDGFSDDGNYDLTTRVTGLLHWSEDGERYVHLGASYSHQFRGAERLRYRARPSAHLADRLVDTEFPAPGTANLITDGVDLFNAEFAWVHGPFSLQGEGILSHVDVDNGASRDFWGAYAQASWFLTGEHRAYNQDRGTFGRTSPIQNFDLWQGHWGAWEIAARYSFLDLDDGSIQGGKLHDVVAGLNWYLFPNARIMWNYVYAHVNSGGDFNGGEMRFALDF